MKWFKLYNNIIYNLKIQSLDDADKWGFVAICCLENEGVLEEPEPVRTKLVSLALGRSIEESQALRERLIDMRLVTEGWHPASWEEKQNSPTTAGAKRQKQYREKQKEKKDNVTRDVTRDVTSNVTHITRESPVMVEEEIELEIEKEYKPYVKVNDDVIAPTEQSRVPVVKIIDLYHKILPDLPKVQKITPARRTNIKTRWKEDLPALENWENFFLYIADSPFLMGKTEPLNGRKPFTADLEWVTKTANYTKILEGKYHGV